MGQISDAVGGHPESRLKEWPHQDSPTWLPANLAA